MFTDDQKRRYARHLLIPQIGQEGQERLLASKVMVIGAGGLGASALSYLAACGIGTIGIVDDDKVELSNLNRQIIHESGDVGRAKVESASDRLSELNPEIRVITHAVRLDANNAAGLISGYNIVIDGTDNFPARFALNDAALLLSIPWVHAAVRGLEGQITSFLPNHQDSPCYRCFVPDAPPDRNDCAERGILGSLVGMMGCLMATEAIRLLLGIGESYHRRLMRYDALSGGWKESRLTKDPECSSCIHIQFKPEAAP